MPFRRRLVIPAASFATSRLNLIYWPNSSSPLWFVERFARAVIPRFSVADAIGFIILSFFAYETATTRPDGSP